MDENEKHTVGLPVLLTLASFVVVVAGMKAASSILVPFFLAVFIAVLCTPPLLWLQGRGVPRVLAVILILAVILAFGSLLGVLVGTSLNKFVSSLPQYQERLTVHLSPLLNWLVKEGVDLPKGGIGAAIHPENAMRLAANLLSAVSNVLANAFLILRSVVFYLLEAGDLPKKLKTALKKPEGSLTTIERFSRSANRYVVIKTLLSFDVGLATWLWHVIHGDDYPILWGTLAFLLNYVPNIGSILATIPATLLALVQLGAGSAILAVLGLLVIHNILGTIVEPRLMGRGLGLSPLVVFISLVFWGWVLGPVGMVLSVPLTSLVKIGLESSGQTQGLAIMLGSDIEK